MMSVSGSDPDPDQGRTPRVLLITPHNSYRIVPYLHAARDLGIELCVVSGGKHSLVSAVADGVHVDFTDTEAAFQIIIADGCQRTVDAVVATDDATVEIASRVAQHLGLPHNPPAAVLLAHRKDLARKTLAKAGLPVPAFRCLDLRQPLASQLEGLIFPCVVKPLSLSASRGVIRADNADELAKACDRIQRLLQQEAFLDEQQRQTVLVEQFLPGVEVAVEAMLVEGQLQVLAMFDKPEPLNGPYFEESYYVMPSRLDAATQGRIIETVAKACIAYGLHRGPVHAELRIDQGQPWILEIAARTIGGECARLLQIATGSSLESHVLNEALGRRPDIESLNGGAGVLMIPIPEAGVLRRVEGVMAASRIPGIEEVRINLREGHEVIPLPEGAAYLGFIYAQAATTAEAEQALRAAHACLNIVVAPMIRLEKMS